MNQDNRSLIERGLQKYRREKVGTRLRPPLGNETATPDAIRHFADGLGDANPLWRDEAYGRQSCHGTMIASPLFLNAVSEGQAIVGLPGLIATYVGSDWEWFRIIRPGDRFSVTNELLDPEELEPREGQRRFLQSGILDYVNQTGESVGRCRWRMLRTEAQPGRMRRGAPEGRPAEAGIPRYTPEELAEIYRAVEAEEIRGGRHRNFEAVRVGSVLTPVVKGPLALSDMVAWAMGIGWHRQALAHGPKLLYLRGHPGLAYTDPDTGAPEPIANSHYLPTAARLLMGSSLPLDLGFQRVCWLGHLVTNWMSDAGFLQRLEVRLTGLVRFGDTVWCEGRVSGKSFEDGRGLVDLEITGRNQRGETVATGRALVALPIGSMA